MKFQQPKIPVTILAIAAGLIISAIVFLQYGKSNRPLPCYKQQFLAAKLYRKCIDTLGNAPRQLPDSLSRILDPNHTNLIGVEYSLITTTLGDLPAKRTSTNPDFAALLVHWFHELNLKKGDIVAIGSSGSFPALIIATICAAQIMELQPVTIVSSGASGYGANRPDFTYLDMERYLADNGLIRFRSTAASLGGSGDLATGLSSGGKHLLTDAIRRNEIPFIHESNLTQNVKIRAKIYQEQGVPKVFINIGGAQINIGDYSNEKELTPGLNTRHLRRKKGSGSMIEYFLANKIPVIHLLNIKTLASQYGIDIDPIPLPATGKSGVYFNAIIPSWIWLICSFFIMSGWILLIRERIKK